MRGKGPRLEKKNCLSEVKNSTFKDPYFQTLDFSCTFDVRVSLFGHKLLLTQIFGTTSDYSEKL